MPPFVPFPVFPPYQFWLPHQSYPTPVNAEARSRLEKINPDSRPFTSLYFCHEFLHWCALTAPRQLFDYSMVVQPLETLLLWSGATGRSMIDLQADDIEEFMRFYVAPPISWSGARVTKYLGDVAIPYPDWKINPSWRPFNRSYDQDGIAAPIVRQATADRFRVLRDFFRYYFALIGSARSNPVAPFEILQQLQTHKVSSLVGLTETQMDWLFDFLTRCSEPSALKISLFLALARFTGYSATAIVGSEFHRATLGQFQLHERHRWAYSVNKNPNSYELLPEAFTPVFEAFLRAMGVDSTSPLPHIHLFPKVGQRAGLSKAAIAREIIRFRKKLVDAAQSSESNEIRLAAAKLESLSFSLIRRSAKK